MAEDARPGVLAGLIVCALDRLGFEGGEKRLDDGIVVAVALTRHTLRDAVGLQFGSKGATGVLAAPIRMMRQARQATALLRGHLECRERQNVSLSDNALLRTTRG